MVVKCPKCGGRVSWSMGEWECIECGHKFKVEKKETVHEREIAPTPTYVEPTLVEGRGEELPTPKPRIAGWLVISIVLLVAGLFSGYVLGMVFPLTETMITKTVFVPATIQITTTYTEKYVETFTKTHTVTVVTNIERPTPTREEYILKVLETVIDTVSEKDYDYYIMLLEAKYIGGRSWRPSALYASLLSDAGYRYYAIIYPEALLGQPLGGVELPSGGSVRGQVAFKLPKNEKPFKLIYEDMWIILEITDIPKPRGEISHIYFVEINIRSDYSIIWASGSKKTLRTVFYSSESIEVELDIKYNRVIGNPLSITITSIDVEEFEIVEVDPGLPLIVNDGEEVRVGLILKVPEKAYKGNLKITITT